MQYVAWISKAEFLWSAKAEWFWAIPPPFSALPHLRIVAEEDGWAHPVLRLVEYDGHRVVNVPARPHLRAVRALRRTEPSVRKAICQRNMTATQRQLR